MQVVFLWKYNIMSIKDLKLIPFSHKIHFNQQWGKQNQLCFIQSQPTASQKHVKE